MMGTARLILGSEHQDVLARCGSGLSVRSEHTVSERDPSRVAAEALSCHDPLLYLPLIVWE